MKNIKTIYLKIFVFWVVKFSIYLNRLVFVMAVQSSKHAHQAQLHNADIFDDVNGSP